MWTGGFSPATGLPVMWTGGFSPATGLPVMWTGGGTSEIVGIKILIKQNDQIFEAFLPNLEHSLSKELLEVLFRYVQKTKGNDLAQLRLVPHLITNFN